MDDNTQADIPLDDLLPTSDVVFEPVESGEFFDTGSAFWEVADMFKWTRPDPTFEAGYRAAMFEAALKSGRAFRFQAGLEGVECYRRRAAMFGRQVTEGKTIEMLQCTMIAVSGHDDSE